MIGVSASASDLEMAEEFFELFKTPWEPAVRGRRYPVLLSSDGRIDDFDAGLFVIYGSAAQASDREAGIPVARVDGPVDVAWGTTVFPVYGEVAQFGSRVASGALTADGRCVDYRGRWGTRPLWRIGYDLFKETRHLLSEGQPAARASTPTLELHIALLRHVLLQSGLSFAEIPPRPPGRDFICCLTHDVDFHGIRRHKLDRTMLGFLTRASFGTLFDLVRGRRSLIEALRNWGAVLSLPFVHVGVARDFWRPFESYARAEEGRRSTFFVVPRKGEPGVAPNGSTVKPLRAVPYQASEIGQEIRHALNGGSEIAVHGIDAWHNAAAGRAEMQALTAVTGQQAAGVRMHWLYFAEGSPRALEHAGFVYDSTWGYNDAVGYRAGTSQVFRLSRSGQLLELPLSIMDSAMFFRGRMDLRRDDALQRCFGLIANARRFGGTLVVNWHDRSLAPERLWDESYRTLLNEIATGDRAWFATAGEAVEWFRWRRSVRFLGNNGSGVTVASSPKVSSLPPVVIRINRPDGTSAEEVAFDGSEAVRVGL